MKKFTLILLCALLVLSGGFLLLRLSYSKTTSFDSSKPFKIFDLVRNEKTLTDALESIGIKKAMSKLVEESSGGRTSDCHQEAHTIGRLGYKVYEEKAFGQCDPSCHSGCYHGAMESFLHESGTENLAQNIDRICKAFDTSFGEFECLHGVGHGVLAYMDYDVPAGLEECENLSTTFGQRSCIGGLFMENVLTGEGLGASKKQDHATNWLNKTDPYFPCNKIDQNPDVQYECYQMQTSWMLYMYRYDFDKVAKACLKAPANYISVCFKSFGRDAAGHTLRDPQKILEMCNKVPRTKDYYNQCIIGAVNVIIDFWGPNLKNQATELCALLPEPGKKTCYQTLAERIPNLFNNTEQRQKMCYTFEEQYRHLCSI